MSVINRNVSHQSPYGKASGFLYLGILILLIIWAIQFSVATYENRRIAYTLDSDGPYQTDRLLSMLELGVPFADGFYNYGNTQHFFAFFLAAPFSLLTSQANEFFFSALALQIVQLSFGSAGAVALYFLGKDLTKSKTVALISLPALFTSPAVFFWFYQIHPDIIQLALIILFVFFLHFRGYRFSLYLAGLCLGIAIGTKYQAGLFLVFFFVWAIVSSKQSNAGKLNLNKLFLQTRNFLFATIVGFGVPNFSILLQPFAFINDVVYEARHVSYGHGSEASKDGFLWVPIIFGEAHVLIVGIGLLLLLGVVTLGFRDLMVRVFSKPLALASLVTLVLGVGHLFFFVNYREARFFIYLLVPLVVIFWQCFSSVASQLRLKQLFSAGPWKLAILLLAATSLIPNFQSLNTRIETARDDVRIEVGDYLLEVCSTDARVLLPIYSYAPPEFQNTVAEFGYLFTQNDIDESEILVLNSFVPGQHIWVEGGTIVRGNLDFSSGQYSLFAPILSGESDFELVSKFDEVMVFAKKSSSPCDL